jgi:hypothetical protein
LEDEGMLHCATALLLSLLLLLLGYWVDELLSSLFYSSNCTIKCLILILSASPSLARWQNESQCCRCHR